MLLNKKYVYWFLAFVLNSYIKKYLVTNLIMNIFSEGGFFKAHLHFPKEYPLRPPRMKFVTEIWHPNSK